MILLAGEIRFADTELAELSALGPVVQLDCESRDAFFAKLEGAYKGVRAIYRHNDSARRIGVFDAALLERLPACCKYICHNGAGYDQIDVGAAARRGIQVSHTPGAVDDATATTAMYLIIATMRNFSAAEASARAGTFKGGLALGSDPEGKTLGIVGLGGIGRALARRAQAFGMRVAYHNRRAVPAEKLPFEAAYHDSLHALLRSSDVVALSVPLNEQTRGLIGRAELAAMRPGSFLVNTARGAVVDADALAEALASGHLRGAGLDVYPDEPRIDARLAEGGALHTRTTLLPHVGTFTAETERKLEALALHNVRAALQTGRVLNLVAEQENVFSI